jgi:hypothetical protein
VLPPIASRALARPLSNRGAAALSRVDWLGIHRSEPADLDPVALGLRSRPCRSRNAWRGGLMWMRSGRHQPDRRRRVGVRGPLSLLMSTRTTAVDD